MKYTRTGISYKFEHHELFLGMRIEGDKGKLEGRGEVGEAGEQGEEEDEEEHSG